ncbi:hypothetical protein DTO212C5_4796 [Paecilomyces variotii]|nr:hypothetical protein DTO212C5_4796 [Paecilomyces variotii]
MSSSRTMIPSYRSYVAHMTARNPSLAALSDFLGHRTLALHSSTVSYMEIGHGGHAGQPRSSTCTELVSKVNLGLTSGLVIVIENLHPDDVETLGSSWDIDPFFFCGHVASSYQVAEDGLPSPLMALPPSRIASQEYFDLHYHKVVDLGDESTLGHLPYKLVLQANIPRIVRRLPGLILVDPTTADIIARKPGTITQSEDVRIRIPQVPGRINVEDFRELPTCSAFWASGSTDSDARDPNMRKDLLRLFRVSPPNWKQEEPSILSLFYYPVKVVAAEWIVYSLLMGRYVKFYEYSFHTAQSRVSHFEHADVLELHRWRRRSQQSLHKLRMTRYFVEYWGEKEPTTIWHQLVLDFKHLEEQIEQHARSLEVLSPINTSLVQLIDSRKSISQAEDVKRLSFVALVFIPLSFVTGIFSMAEQ